MTPETTQWLRDALGAAELIARNSHDQTYAKYVADTWFQSAVERQLEIIGEALNRAVRAEPEIIQVVPDVRGWIGLRNVLAHAYDHIRVNIVWDTVQQEIPGLIETLSRQLANRQDQLPTEHAPHLPTD